jgi:hypothetical protein
MELVVVSSHMLQFPDWSTLCTYRYLSNYIRESWNNIETLCGRSDMMMRSDVVSWPLTYSFQCSLKPDFRSTSHNDFHFGVQMKAGYPFGTLGFRLGERLIWLMHNTMECTRLWHCITVKGQPPEQWTHWGSIAKTNQFRHFEETVRVYRETHKKPVSTMCACEKCIF